MFLASQKVAIPSEVVKAYSATILRCLDAM